MCSILLATTVLNFAAAMSRHSCTKSGQYALTYEEAFTSKRTQLL